MGTAMLRSLFSVLAAVTAFGVIAGNATLQTYAYHQGYKMDCFHTSEERSARPHLCQMS
jgi:hypothetical protein